MKKLLILLFGFLFSIAGHSQTGFSGVFLRVQDSATYVNSANTLAKHTAGYADIWFSDASNLFWKWNGSAYELLSSGGGAVNFANNGLHLDADTVKLGGDLKTLAILNGTSPDHGFAFVNQVAPEASSAIFTLTSHSLGTSFGNDSVASLSMQPGTLTISTELDDNSSSVGLTDPGGVTLQTSDGSISSYISVQPGGIELNSSEEGYLNLQIQSNVLMLNSSAPVTPTTQFLRGDMTWAVPAGGGGGITNTAAAGEIPQSNGTNLVPSSLFVSANADITMGNGAMGGGSRNIVSNGGGTNVPINIRGKGALGYVCLNNNLVVDGGFVGVGTSIPFRKLDVTGRYSSTNTVEQVLRIHRESSGSVTAGGGVGMEFSSQTQGTTGGKIGATLNTIATDIGLSTEDFDFSINTMTAGATATEKFRLTSTGYLQLPTVGQGLAIKEGGPNAMMGVITLAAGTATINTTKVTANSRIFLIGQSLGTITIPQAYQVSARTAATSFTILSSSNTDTSQVAWFIVEPAP